MAPAWNLGKPGRNARLRRGVAAFAAAQVLALGLAHLRAGRPARAALFAPLFLAAWWIAQGLSGADPLLAARGLRDVGDGPEPIADAAELARVRAAARLVNGASLAAAAVLTAVLVLTAE